MKKIVLLLGLTLGLSCLADVAVSNLTTTAVTVITNATVTVKQAKVVWTSFAIVYTPPDFQKATYTVNYTIIDEATGKEVTGARGTKRMTEKEVFDFAKTKGVDFSQMGQGIGYLLNEYLKTLFPKPQ